MEDIFARDRLVAILPLEVLQCKERYVVLSPLAVVAIGVERKAICCRPEPRRRNEIRNQIRCDAGKGTFDRHIDAQEDMFSLLALGVGNHLSDGSRSINERPSAQ